MICEEGAACCDDIGDFTDLVFIHPYSNAEIATTRPARGWLKISVGAKFDRRQNRPSSDRRRVMEGGKKMRTGQLLLPLNTKKTRTLIHSYSLVILYVTIVRTSKKQEVTTRNVCSLCVLACCSIFRFLKKQKEERPKKTVRISAQRSVFKVVTLMPHPFNVLERTPGKPACK